MKVNREIPLGASLLPDNRCNFLVWAPRAQTVDIHIISAKDRLVSMEAGEHGYFAALVDAVPAGALYRYRLNGEVERPDPASAFQPEGVHGPSQVVDSRFNWTDANWRGLPIHDYVLYEIHAGTFTPEGTLDAIIPRIADLKSLGITAIEIMPVAQFPGARNWGYDGVYPFAVQNSYGGPDALKRLVDACHSQEVCVVLDVVYNHLGPEGNYAGDFGFYFTDAYKTPWGAALNFDQEYSDEVRRYFIENALRWITEFHIDGLRLDAIHAIVDPSAQPFVKKLAEACHNRGNELNRQVQIIAETNRNDNTVVNPAEQGGWALDGQWNDDFHHSLRVAFTNERVGYYQDYSGLPDLVKAFQEGFVYAGGYSRFRKHSYGSSSRDVPGHKLLVFSQNHDQAGNRKVGDRLTAVLSFAQLKLAAAVVLLSPYVPLLLMGEEYGEKSPFQYFVSHSDRQTIEAVRQGRAAEFAGFEWLGELPDPQDERTFLNSKLHWDARSGGEHRVLLGFYAGLLRLRREVAALSRLDKWSQEVSLVAEGKCILARRWAENNQVALLFYFGAETRTAELLLPEGIWRPVLDSNESRWNGSGAAPDLLESSGKVQLSLGPWSAAAWVLTA